MAAGDRISALPNDVLQHVLSFAPAREAAATAILSRRWRSVWRRTGAIILDSKPYKHAQREIGYYSPAFDTFFRDAHAALAAFRRPRGGSGLKRLTLALEEGTYHLSRSSWYNKDPEPEKDSRVHDLLDDPAVARLEELIVSCENSYHRRYAPPLHSLPCAATLRVLELTRCNLEQPSHQGGGAMSFPHLTDLTMRNCYFLEGCLQATIDAAPALANLALANVHQRAPEPAGSTKKDFYMLPFRVRSPTVTSLAVTQTYVEDEKELEASSSNGGRIELDMPSLRFFRYYGFRIKLALTSPTPGLARVDLNVTASRQRVRWDLKYEPPSRILANFSSTRALKLRLGYIEDLIAADEVPLTAFPNLKLLELDAKYQYMNGNTAVAMATLLRSCPAMSELRLRLNMRWDYDHERKYENHVGGSFGEAMDRFESLGSMSSAHRDAVQIGGVSELPDAFTNNGAFSCLQRSLRKVTLQFKAKEANCFQVQLAKFLVENAMVLEEMHVDDGIRFWPDRLFHKLARWRADAFCKRNLQLPDTATGFQVYQLPSTVVDPEQERSLYYSFD
ncbi:hypothetical protein QYE76_055709 [Lolium multiflorum]|uniref:F-box domain-containing protein n=1 Tax=Lolium multiflorum TaxID=4521 RepID=A0AAD8T129_LOLMU|nr:hypothetical protein QYE76_055709 [Lolium multiflorum]